MKMKIKRVATLALSLLMLVLCMTPACFAVAQKEKYGILSLVSDGISITARVSDIERWVNAKSDDEKATVEAELLSNPNNKIEPITNNPFVKVNSVDDAGLRSNPESAEEKYGVLTLYEQGVSIKAPVADIEAYTHEKEIGKKEQLLNELLENPQNTVSYFEATPYEDSQEAKTIDVGE